jgi:hypothetical protein
MMTSMLCKSAIDSVREISSCAGGGQHGRGVTALNGLDGSPSIMNFT